MERGGVERRRHDRKCSKLEASVDAVLRENAQDPVDR